MVEEVLAALEKKGEAIQQLLDKRKEIDEKLTRLGYAPRASKTTPVEVGRERRRRRCANCHQIGHTAPKCPQPTILSNRQAKEPDQKPNLVKAAKHGG